MTKDNIFYKLIKLYVVYLIEIYILYWLHSSAYPPTFLFSTWTCLFSYDPIIHLNQFLLSSSDKNPHITRDPFRNILATSHSFFFFFLIKWRLIKRDEKKCYFKKRNPSFQIQKSFCKYTKGDIHINNKKSFLYIR